MLVTTTTQLAELFSVTDRAVRLWSDKGCPKAGHGKWHLKDVLNWWLENIYRAEEDGEELAAAKLEYWQSKAKNETVKANIAEKSVMLVKDFKEAWMWRVSEMSNGLGSLPMRVSPLVAEKSELEARKILTDEIWKIRDKFARTGTFTPTERISKTERVTKKSIKKNSVKDSSNKKISSTIGSGIETRKIK